MSATKYKTRTHVIPESYTLLRNKMSKTGQQAEYEEQMKCWEITDTKKRRAGGCKKGRTREKKVKKQGKRYYQKTPSVNTSLIL